MLLGVLGLSEGGVAVGAQRVGAGPRAGGVHDSAGEQSLAAGGALDVHGERVVLAPGVDQEVATGAADADHAGVVHDGSPGGAVQQRGKRRQVRRTPLAPGRVGVVVGCRPGAGRVEEPAGGGVHELAPRGEESDVGPLADGGTRVRAGLQDDEVHPALGGVGCGGQADGAGSDDDQGVGVPHVRSSVSLSCIDGRR